MIATASSFVKPCFAWSESNDENLLLIDSSQVAAACVDYFNALYQTYGGSSIAR